MKEKAKGEEEIVNSARLEVTEREKDRAAGPLLGR